MDPAFLAFAGVAALLTLSPGPDMAVMLRNVLRGGQAVVVPTALGTCAGLLAWGAASSLGIAALMAASAELFLVLRLAGAAYLVYLGVTAFRAALAGDPREAQGVEHEPMTRWAAFRSGLLTNLLNPKIGVFYATLLPQFIPPGAPPLVTSVALAGIHAAENIVWLIVYGWLLARFGDRILRGRGRQLLEGLTGTVLVVLGVRVAVDALARADQLAAASSARRRASAAPDPYAVSGSGRRQRVASAPAALPASTAARTSPAVRPHASRKCATKASPQPTVVPWTSTESTGTHVSVSPSRASATSTPCEPNVIDDEPAQRVSDLDEPADRRVARVARPADEADVDGTHGAGESIDAVVAEAEEVGAHLGAFQVPARMEALELADGALDQDDVQAVGLRDPPLLVGCRAVGGPHAFDEVVHEGLEIGLDDDVDRGRRALRDEVGCHRQPVALEEGAEHRWPVVADAGEEVPGASGAGQVPRHVQGATAGEDQVAPDVDVEAGGSQEQAAGGVVAIRGVGIRGGGVRCGGGARHRPASGSGRSSPSARKRS